MSFESFEPTDEDAIILRSLSIMPMIRAYSWTTGTEGAEVVEEQLHGEVQLRVIPPKQGFVQTIESDKLHTLSYFDLAQRISVGLHHRTSSTTPHQNLSFDSIEYLTELISRLIFTQIFPDSSLATETQTQFDPNKTNSFDADEEGQFRVQVVLKIPKLIRFANGISLSIARRFASSTIRPESLDRLDHLDKISIDHISSFAIIGLLPRERLQKQKVICSLTLFKPPFCRFPHAFDLFNISKSVYVKMTESEFYTVEALADSIGNLVMNLCNSETITAKKVKVRIEKPEAVSWALGAGVEITKSV